MNMLRFEARTFKCESCLGLWHKHCAAILLYLKVILCLLKGDTGFGCISKRQNQIDTELRASETNLAFTSPAPNLVYTGDFP